MEGPNRDREGKKARTDHGQDAASAYGDLLDRVQVLQLEEESIKKEIEAQQRRLAAKRNQIQSARGEMGRLLVEMLPTDLWAAVLSFLSLDDGLKQCTLASKFFFTVAPQIRCLDDVTLKIQLSSKLVQMTTVWKNPVWRAFLSTQRKRRLDLLARFRNVRSIKIVEYKQHTIKPGVLSLVLRCFPALERLTLAGLDSTEGYLRSNEKYYKNFTCDFRFDDFTASEFEELREFHFDGTTKELMKSFGTVGSTLEYLSLEKCYLAPPVAIYGLSALERLKKLKMFMHEKMSEARDFMDPEIYSDIEEEDAEGLDTHRFSDDIQALGETIGACLSHAVPSLMELTLDTSHDGESREIYIDSDDFNIGFMKGCTRLKQLKVLHSLFLCSGWSNQSLGIKPAQMLLRFKTLEEISVLRYPSIEFLNGLLEGEGTVCLKKVSAYFFEGTREVFATFVNALNGRFLHLEEVVLDLSDQYTSDRGIVNYPTALQILGGLKHHPCLKKIRIMIGSSDSDVTEVEDAAYLADFWQCVGDKIQVEKLSQSLDLVPE